MATQQHAKQIRRLSDQFWRDLEYMPQDELFCSIVTQHTGAMSFLGVKKRLKISAIQGGYHRIAQVWEYLSKVER